MPSKWSCGKTIVPCVEESYTFFSGYVALQVSNLRNYKVSVSVVSSDITFETSVMKVRQILVLCFRAS